MNYLKLFFIILIISVFTISCTTTQHAQKKPPIKFGGTTLAKHIKTQGTTAIPEKPSTTFTTLDNKVVAHLKFENMSGKYKLRWDWYSPNGQLYYTTGDFPVQTSRNSYLKEVTTWHSLTLKGDKAVSMPGQWQVKIFLNNDLVDTQSFMLTSLADQIALPRDVAQKPFPKDWGLIIGIEDYAHLPKVEFARKDALIVKEYFIKVLGIPEENIISLIDGDATKARIEGYLLQYIPANINKDTTLYVYFAGHGAPDMKKGDPYLVPYDGDTRFIEQTGYKLKKFYNDLDNLSIQRSYVFLDSCFSGVANRAAEMLAKGSRPALIQVQNVNLKNNNVVSLSASSMGQTSNSYPETGHGLFTYYLLRALNGDADSDDDRWISIKEIFDYVNRNVSRVAKRMGAEQNPAITPALESLKDISISKILQ